MSHPYLKSIPGTLLACILFSACGGKTVELVTPTESPITEAVFAPGHMEAAGQFILTALNEGYITDVQVTEGDTVRKGTVLFVQDNTVAAIQQKAAVENLSIARRNASENSAILQQLKAQLEAANAQLDNSKTQLDRMQKLYQTKSVARVDLDNAQQAYDNAVANVKALQENIEATKLELQQQLVNSRSQQETAAANNGYFNVQSPGYYKVYDVLKKKGELAHKGENLAVLGSPDSLLIVLSVDEESIDKVRIGQVVLTELNTEKGRTYTGRVTRIYPSFDTQNQAYKVEAQFDTIPPRLINGTLVQSNIVVDKKQQALLIPRSALSPDGKVIVKGQKQLDTVAIQTGIISTEWVEVLSGLSKTDQVVKSY